MVEVVHLGVVDYQRGREIQSRLVQERLRGVRSDTLLICEHPPVVTLGVRSTEYPILDSIPVIRTTRGGEATYHGPGQLLLYPVVELSRIGVRRFVEGVLSTMARGISQFGVSAVGQLDPAGVWLENGQKIGACGLKIVRKVTDHGFSINIDNDLQVYSRFKPCGLSGEIMTSLRLASGVSFSAEEVVGRVSRLTAEYITELRSEECGGVSYQ